MVWNNEEMCKKAANLLQKKGEDFCYVNLGIGMPTGVANYCGERSDVVFHSENGLLGIGDFPEDIADPDLINAGKETVTCIPNACFFDSAESFGMIRAGRIDYAILGAMEVSYDGDLANWNIPGKVMKGMGGAMDLVAGARHVIVLMKHKTKNGASKIVPKCTLPLTGRGVVNKVVTEYGIFDINKEYFSLVDRAEDVSIEEIIAITCPNLSIRL